MENLAKPSLGFFSQMGMKKFLLAILTIAALSGAVLVTHSSPAAACGYTCNGGHPWQGGGE
jgi:hypothetical protein